MQYDYETIVLDKEKYKELVEKINNNQNEKEQILESLKALEQSKKKIDEELEKIVNYYNDNPGQEFNDAWKAGEQAAAEFDFGNTFGSSFNRR